ncbi:MAG: GAF domain-containing protein [Umezawaea sp.]
MKHDNDDPTGETDQPGARPAEDSESRSLFGRSSAAFAVLSGPAHVVDAANPTFFEAIGGGERVRTRTTPCPGCRPPRPQRSPAGHPQAPGPWGALAVTGYVCVPLTDRGRALGALTLLTTDGPALDGHAVHLAEELASRASHSACNARQYTEQVQAGRSAAP